MRKLSLFCSLLFFSFTLLSAQKTAKPSSIVDLQEALDKKMVSLTVQGVGGYQGEALKVVCKNLRGQYLRLRIPQGQLMEPADSSQQTLVVIEERLLAVTAKTPVEASLKTFCTQAGDASPSKGSAFSIGALAPQQLCNLLKYLVESGKTDAADAQTAVWCITNNQPLGDIGDSEMVKFVARQLGKEAPGYKIRRQTVQVLPGQRAELGKALVIESNFTYTLDKAERTFLVLLDGNGKFIKKVSKEEDMIAGEHRSGLRLEVYNLPAGKYILRMQTKAGRVIKDMEVDF